MAAAAPSATTVGATTRSARRPVNKRFIFPHSGSLIAGADLLHREADACPRRVPRRCPTASA
jgi:hypothetical protein